MKVEYINSFYEATKSVFDLMLDLGVKMGELKVSEGMISSRDANVVLGVTGDVRGNVIFGFPRDMTLEMVKMMSGMEMKEIDGFVSSALGEVANIIGGNAVTDLAHNDYRCDIVPPQIFVGEYKSMAMANEKALCLPMMTDIGEFEINIYLKEK